MEMKTLDSYMKNLHEQLKNDYKNEDGSYFSCSEIARNIESILKSMGKTPTLFIVRGSPVENSPWFTKPLVPKAYDGRIEWDEHYVCFSEGMAYEPVLGKPVLAADYSNEMFGGDAEIFPVFGKEDFMELLSEILSKTHL